MESKKLVLILATTPNSEKDRVYLRRVRDMLSPVNVFSVSTSQACVDKEWHIQLNFNTEFDGMLWEGLVFMQLDAGWLEPNYWRDRYGLDWVSHKLPLAFERCPLLAAVLLPVMKFKGKEDFNVMFKREESITRGTRGNISWEALPMRVYSMVSPYARAILKQDEEDGAEKWAQHIRCLDSNTPYLAFHPSSSSDWKKHSDSLFQF